MPIDTSFHDAVVENLKLKEKEGLDWKDLLEKSKSQVSSWNELDGNDCEYIIDDMEQDDEPPSISAPSPKDYWFNLKKLRANGPSLKRSDPYEALDDGVI